MRTKLAVMILCASASASVGQQSTEIETKYGKPTSVYSVSDRIWMTPDYGNDGQLCRMRLFAKRIDGEGNYLAPTLPFEELKQTLGRLAPLKDRGKKDKD